jgi:hypothetical protein
MQIKLPKAEKHFKKGGINTSPDFFWDILLSLSAAIILTAFLFGFLLFRQINKGSILPGNIAGESDKNLDKEKIKKTLQYFSNKESISNNIRQSPSPIADPSVSV